MKASELRIGNWIKDGNDFEQVTIDHLNCLNSGRCEFDKVPLTEEWLLKFGFEESENCYELEINNSISIFFAGYLGVMINGVFSFLDKDFIYVHQLQNLYFALEYEELTIKQTNEN